MPDLVTSSPANIPGVFGKTREAVLGLLVLRPDEEFHLRQISRLAGAGLGPVQRELAQLVTMGIITREESGRQVYFQARADCPILPELCQLLRKTSGAAAVLRTALADFKGDILAAVIFGSVASGTMNLQSDVDLLIISRRLTTRDLGAAIRQASAKLGRDVNINLYRPEEWKTRAQAGHPLARSILANPRITLIGDPDDLVRLAEKRVAETASTRKNRNSPAL